MQNKQRWLIISSQSVEELAVIMVCNMHIHEDAADETQDITS